MTKHYVDNEGNYLGGFDGEGVVIPDGAIEVPAPPHGLAKWINEEWVMPPPSRAEVNAEADRRAKAGFVFGGKHYQFDDLAKSRITGAAALAHQALTIGGKAPTDTKWHNAGGADDPEFLWIASDNSLNVMDAQTVLAFGQTAAAWESAHVFAAKALKDMDPIPANFTDDAYWP
jgi:hypothetical protein